MVGFPTPPTRLTLLVIRLFDLVAHPDVIPALREEIRAVTGENDGVMTTKALFQMKLLDSVLKESQRINPTGLGRFIRRVLKPLVLSDGTQIPADTTIEVAYGSMTKDPAVFPNPEVCFCQHQMAQTSRNHILTLNPTTAEV